MRGVNVVQGTIIEPALPGAGSRVQQRLLVRPRHVSFAALGTGFLGQAPRVCLAAGGSDDG